MNKKKTKNRSFLYHIHPPTVPQDVLKFTHTWGLGGSAFVLLIMQIITGVLLLFAYSPTPEAAYPSIMALQQNMLFGKLIRNLHHWSANFLVLVVFFHMLRVFFTGAYINRRKVNWWIGLALFICVLAANFTGYLLPLDQLSYWAITICTHMFEYIPLIGSSIQKFLIGGPEIGETTLSNFFAIHIALVPICMAGLMPFHFWQIRKARGVICPVSTGGSDKKVASVPHLVTREAAMALVVIASIFLFSEFFDAPLAEKANPGLSPNPTKAPWYFSGLQELLQHFHPMFAVFFIPLCVLVGLIFLPYVRFEKSEGGAWFLSKNGRRTGVVSATSSLVIVSLWIVLNEHFLNISNLLPAVSPVVSNGVIPTTLIIVFMLGFFRFMKQKFSATREETVQALFIFILVVFVVLTVTGVWFRGPGMMLTWPWDITGNQLLSVK